MGVIPDVAAPAVTSFRNSAAGGIPESRNIFPGSRINLLRRFSGMAGKSGSRITFTTLSVSLESHPALYSQYKDAR